ncbi:hypothetical protein C4564_06335 [Candidatus Microgenomates bacterium]|nr:MAG: hypothetical protein C4564_06335 [Candidatus Microgenomates bacterium]
MSKAVKIVLISISALIVEYVLFVLHFASMAGLNLKGLLNFKWIVEKVLLTCSGRNCPNDGFSMCDPSTPPRMCNLAYEHVVVVLILYFVIWIVIYVVQEKVLSKS